MIKLVVLMSDHASYKIRFAIWLAATKFEAEMFENLTQGPHASHEVSDTEVDCRAG